jgi:hypothetical protein
MGGYDISLIVTDKNSLSVDLVHDGMAKTSKLGPLEPYTCKSISDIFR